MRPARIARGVPFVGWVSLATAIALTPARSAHAQHMVSGCGGETPCMTVDEAAYIAAVLEASIVARDQGLCHDAVVGLRLAFAHYPDPRIAVRLADCLEELGDTREAAELYASALETSDADTAALASERLAALAPERANHLSSARATETSVLALDLSRHIARDHAEWREVRQRRRALGTALGSAIGFGATAVTFGLIARGRDEDVRDYDRSAPTATRDELEALQSDADRAQRVAGVTATAAAAAGGIALGLLIREWVGDDDRLGVTIAPGPGATRFEIELRF